MAEELDNIENEDEDKSHLLDHRNEFLEPKTHELINQSLCGILEDLQDGYAKVKLATTEEMIADKKGLVHSGFIFSAANFAAVSAINKPNVILAVSRCNFLAPIKVEDEVIFEATAVHNTTRKRDVRVIGLMGGIKVFEGEFSVVVLEKHVLGLQFINS